MPDYESLNRDLAWLGYSNWKQAADEANSETPTYTRFGIQTLIATKRLGGSWNCTGIGSSLPMLRNTTCLNNIIFFLTGSLFAVLLVLIRLKIQPWLMNVARYLKLRKTDAVKLPESIWRGILHSIMWLISLYVVVLSGKYDFFQQPCRVWNRISFNTELYEESPPYDLQFAYWIQMVYYIHSVYTTFCVDQWRWDSVALTMHHLITLSLILTSFINRFLEIGSLVLLIHDTSDVLLEFTKLNVYLKNRNGRQYKINEYLSNIGFILFVFSWFLFRLYWFPLKVIKATSWCIFLFNGCFQPNLYILFNGALWLLQCLHIYWSFFILILLYKILTGKLDQIEDVRELNTATDDAGGAVSIPPSDKTAHRTSLSNSEDDASGAFTANFSRDQLSCYQDDENKLIQRASTKF